MEGLTEKLKNYREENNLTQVQMAKYLGIGERTYQKIETSGKIVLYEDYTKIVEKLSLPTQNISFTQKFASPEHGKETQSNDLLLILARSNEDLARTNRGLAESNKEVAESVKVLARTNENIVNKITGGADQEIPANVAQKFSEVAEMIQKLQKGESVTEELDRFWSVAK